MPKTKIIGRQELVNPATGEIIDVAIVNVETLDRDFHKVWLGNLLMSLEIIGNQKIKVCNWLLSNKNKENVVISSYQKISQETGISKRTVAETIRLLLKANFLRRMANGVYVINPDVVFDGGHHRRMDVLYRYQIQNSVSPSNVISIFSKYNIDIETAPEVILELKKYSNEEIEKVAFTLAEMTKNGDITNPVGFLRRDRKRKITQILEGKIKPNKKEKTTSKKKWSEYEIYDPLKN